MGDHLTESDWERIREFANTPAYERTPEILADPGGDGEGTTERRTESE